MPANVRPGFSGVEKPMMPVSRTTGTIGISPRSRRGRTGLIASNMRLERDGAGSVGSLITFPLDHRPGGAKLRIFNHWNASCTDSCGRNSADKPGEENGPETLLAVC